MYTIAVIDDELYMRKAILSHMEMNDIQYVLVGEAGNGEEGLELLKEKQPQIAIVDISMPKMDGLTMIQKAVEANVTTQFILLTSYSEFEYAKKALTLEVKDYLLKPVNSKELKEVIGRVQDQIQIDENNKMELVSLEKMNLNLMKADFFSGMITTGGVVDKNQIIEILGELEIEKTVFDEYYLVCLNCTTGNVDEIAVAIEDFQKEKKGTFFKMIIGFIYVVCPEILWDEYREKFEQLGRPYGSSKVHKGIENLAKAYMQSYANMKTVQTVESNKISDTVQTYIDENVGDCDLSINAIAKSIYVNYSYLCYCFKRDVGITVNEYIIQKRMESAKNLFAEGAQNISQVAVQVGYSSNSYFSKAFKKYTGISPSEYIQKK